MRHINIDLNNLEPCYKIGRMFEANVVTLNITLPIEFNKNADYYLLEFENSNKETVNTEPLSLDGNVIIYEMPEELTQKGCLNAVLSSYKARDGDTVEIEKSDIINLKFSRSIKSDSVITPAIQGFIEKIVLLIENGKIKGDKGDTGPQGIQGEKGDKGEQGIPGRDAYQFFKTISTGKDLSQFTDGVYLATSDIVITNKSATNKELLLYENTFFFVENIMLISKNKLRFYGNCVFDGENKPYSAYQISEVSGNLSDVSAYTSLLTEINTLRIDTEALLQKKQEKLTAGAGIKIDDNVISADTQFSLVKASGRREEGYTYPVPDVDNPKSNAIYLVAIENPETDDDYHYEWLWDETFSSQGAWELLGTTSLSTIPRKTSELENDSNFVSDANYVHSDNNFTVDEKNKLASLHKFEVGDGLTLENGVLSLNIPTADSNTVFGGEV